MTRNATVVRAIGAAMLTSACARADVLDIHYDAPTLDRWFYPFNPNPGVRITGSTFGNAGLDADFDNRDGELLLGWSTSGEVTPGLGPDAYDVIDVRVTIQVANDDVWFYDDTPDSWVNLLDEADPQYVPDADPGQPIEIFGTGFRSGFDALTFVETGPYSLTGAFGKGIRIAYPLGFDGTTPIDVANSFDGQFDPAPFAIGTISGLAPGALVPVESVMEFSLDTSNPNVQSYLRDALDQGMLDLCVTSLTRVEVQGTAFPSFYLQEHPDVTFGFVQAAQLAIQVEVGGGTCAGDLDANGSIGFGDLVLLLAEWGACSGCPADLDDDAIVGFGDLIMLLTAWGPCP